MSTIQNEGSTKQLKAPVGSSSTTDPSVLVARDVSPPAYRSGLDSAAILKGDVVVFDPQNELIGMAGHDLVTRGVPVALFRVFLKSFSQVAEKDLWNVLGVSTRTIQRKEAGVNQTLDVNASDRMMRLVKITQLATEVLGFRLAAEKWMSQPAMGLEQRRPIDLLQSTEGTEMVRTLLGRIDYGVYA